MKLFRPSKLTSALIARKGQAVPSGYGKLAPSRSTGAPVNANPSPRAGFRSVSHNGAPAKQCETVLASARVSLRLDEARNLRLRLTAAHMQMTLQDILTDALDNYLDQISPEVIRDNGLYLGSESRSPKR